jgi:hypothetical protein
MGCKGFPAYFLLLFVLHVSSASKGFIYGFYQYPDSVTGVYVTNLDEANTEFVANLTVPKTITVAGDAAACHDGKGIIWTVGQSGHYGSVGPHGRKNTIQNWWIQFDTRTKTTVHYLSHVMTNHTGPAVVCSVANFTTGNELYIATRRVGVDPAVAQCRFGRVTFESPPLSIDVFHQVQGTNFSCVDGISIFGNSDSGNLVSLSSTKTNEPSIITTVDMSTNRSHVLRSKVKQVISFSIVKGVTYSFTQSVEVSPTNPPEFLFGRFDEMDGSFHQIGHVNGMYLPPIFPLSRVQTDFADSYYTIIMNASALNNPDGFLLYDWSMSRGDYKVFRFGNDLEDQNQYSAFVWMSSN